MWHDIWLMFPEGIGRVSRNTTVFRTAAEAILRCTTRNGFHVAMIGQPRRVAPARTHALERIERTDQRAKPSSFITRGAKAERRLYHLREILSSTHARGSLDRQSATRGYARIGFETARRQGAHNFVAHCLQVRQSPYETSLCEKQYASNACQTINTPTIMVRGQAGANENVSRITSDGAEETSYGGGNFITRFDRIYKARWSLRDNPTLPDDPDDASTARRRAKTCPPFQNARSEWAIVPIRQLVGVKRPLATCLSGAQG